MLGYHVPEPDEAMLISGARSRGDEPFRVVIGHGKWVMPFFRRVSFLSLAMYEAEIEERCVTGQGILLDVRAVIAFKVANDTASIVNAAQRFLSEQEQEMSTLTGRIFSGHLRSIVGSMTVEEIIRERQKLADEVLTASKIEMGNIGLLVDSFQIQSIDDGNLGYIAALAAPHNAAVQRDAQIAQAQARQAAAEAEQASLREQAKYQRETEITQAEYKKDIDRANAEAAQAAPLAQARAQQEVMEEQRRLAQKRAELREQELQAEVVKPAEAEAERVRIMAQADADRTRIAAEAAASNNRIALDQQLIEQLPLLVSEAAKGLAGARLTVLNGPEGISEMVSGVVAQGLSILGTLKENLGSTNNPDENGQGELQANPAPPVN
ncbi:SPFH domain-containing protein [Mycobacterium shimoidei]|uniref:SPFH domain-containing protein n=1 Tax=Mycobacterium shimoidei TaxID=29313 RepID=UPI0008488736|nr:flotillin family protein [Mycobacterium shimoidei]MCV7258554.1 flotillin [Mycobacterium shimoidei]ODR15495.1 flotillin [Mycobacterium shimoidei]ORW83667.1 flotillin [Mycobacterium shimoidei]